MEVNLNTRLVTSPMPRGVAFNTLKIGSTPVFTFELTGRIFTFDDISQMYFIFRQGNGDVYSFSMIPEGAIDSNGIWNGELDDHFRYDDILNQIVFTMESEETLAFKPTNTCDPRTFLNLEVVAKLAFIGQEKESVMPFKMNDIIVLDSLYKHVIEI